MIRRTFLKMLMASPLVGLVKGKVKSEHKKPRRSEEPFYNRRLGIPFSETTGTSGGEHCWIEAINCEPETWHWDSTMQSVLGVDADSQNLGARIFMKTGQIYECWPRRGQ